MDKKKRLGVQAVAALLQNADFRGFFTGRVSQIPTKAVCVPGLNCYSCPSAVGACPIGALQNALSSYSFKFPYYVLGLLLFFGALLGRAVCGFLCPFGLLQDLLHKIPFFKKIKTFRADKYLRFVKYAVLVLLVIVLPIFVKLTPVFCKYLCPSGTLAGLLLAFSDTRLFALFGSRFMWKACILGCVVLASVLLYRPFCKYLCPLGALYALFNRVALVQMATDPAACVGCGKCAAACDMCVDPSKTPNSAECIRCGKCMTVCPTQAIRYTTPLHRRKQTEDAPPAEE
ncbi:MAG: 4Fe-4S binding protein [Clostridia bacterium]|nr:4Fe-4S binding protein [Clostridia bacterium]